MVWLHSPASNSGGDLAVAADTDQGPSLYLWRDGGFQVVAAQGTVTPPGGGEIHWLNPPLAVNGLGQIAAWTGFDQGQGLLLYSQGATVAQSLMITIKDILFVSWHSTAIGGMDTDTALLFKEIEKRVFFAKNNKVSRVLVGGDFNTDVTNITRIANYLSKKSKIENVIFHPNSKTHKNGGTLDYFVLFYQGQKKTWRPRAVVKWAPVSDHHPVIISF